MFFGSFLFSMSLPSFFKKKKKLHQQQQTKKERNLHKNKKKKKKCFVKLFSPPGRFAWHFRPLR